MDTLKFQTFKEFYLETARDLIWFWITIEKGHLYFLEIEIVSSEFSYLGTFSDFFKRYPSIDMVYLHVTFSKRVLALCWSEGGNSIVFQGTDSLKIILNRRLTEIRESNKVFEEISSCFFNSKETDDFLKNYFLLKKYSISDEYFCGFYDIFSNLLLAGNIQEIRIANLDREKKL